MGDGVAEQQASRSIIHAKRRVNPESLALRLGPDLVRDMEALIVPGNIEMPSFAVRKELQERYNVDRRHIYDYFHSRGLRVVKEEKYRSRLLSLRTPPHCNNKPATLPNTKRRTSRRITELKTGPRENTPINVGCPKDSSAINTQREQPTYYAMNPLVPLRLHQTRVSLEGEECAFRSVTNPSDELFSVIPDAGDLVFRRGRHDYNFQANGQTLTLAPIQQECNATSLYLTNTDTTFFTDAPGPLLSAKLQVICQASSDNLGPACGIEECVGTYRQHVEDRSGLYYDYGYPVDKASLPADWNRVLSLETNFWLSSGKILGSEQIYPARIKQDIQKMTMKQREDGLSYECRVPIGSDQPFVQTLDDLFPTPPMDTSHVIESPVVRSGQFAVDFPFCTPIPEVERELPIEDKQRDDPFEYYTSDIRGFTKNQQNTNIPFEAEETRTFPIDTKVARILRQQSQHYPAKCQ